MTNARSSEERIFIPLHTLKSIKVVKISRKAIDNIYNRSSESHNRGSESHNSGSESHNRGSVNHSRFNMPIISINNVNLFSSRAFVNISAS